MAQFLVIDFGRVYLRTLLASSSSLLRIPNLANTSLHVLQTEDCSTFVGNQALETPDNHTELQQIFDEGKNLNFSCLSFVFKYICSKYGKSAAELSVIVAENLLTHRLQREKLVEYLFNQIKVKALFLCKSPVLSSFRFGRTTSLVINSGADQTTLVPIQDGYPWLKFKGLIKSGGQRFTSQILNSLQKRKVQTRYELDNNKLQLNSSAKKYYLKALAREIKHSAFKKFMLPDGSSFEVPPFNLEDQFFPKQNPTNSLFSLSTDSVRQLTKECSNQILKNVFFIGGNSNFTVLQNRLSQKFKVRGSRLLEISEREDSQVLGGSVLSQLSITTALMVSNAEFQEHGFFVVEKKCV